MQNKYIFVGNELIQKIDYNGNIQNIGYNYNVYEGVAYFGDKNNPYMICIGPEDKNLKTYTLHQDTQIIANKAFVGCNKMVEISLPENIKFVGNSAFEGCTGLKYVNFGSGHKIDIGEYAFYGCSAICNIENIDRITSVGREAFNGGVPAAFVDQGGVYIGDKNNPHHILIGSAYVEKLIIHPETVVAANGALAGHDTGIYRLRAVYVPFYSNINTDDLGLNKHPYSQFCDIVPYDPALLKNEKENNNHIDNGMSF